MKKIMITSLVFSLLVATGIVWFESSASAENGAFQAYDIGNKICPVSGAKIGEAAGREPATYTYEGKIYHFCCAGCINVFKADPEKYIVKINQEIQAK